MKIDRFSCKTLLACLLLTITLVSRAEVVVWDQQPINPPTNFDISSFASAADFNLTTATQLSSMTVWLSDRANGGLDGVLNNLEGSLGWAIYTTAGVTPGALLFSGSEATPIITSTGLLDGAGREIFKVDASFLPMPMLTAGTYWLSIRDGNWGSAFDGTVVGWTTRNPVILANSVFDGNEQNPGTWSTLTFGGDVAFQLRAVEVPAIPPTWGFLLLLGFLISARTKRLFAK